MKGDSVVESRSRILLIVATGALSAALAGGVTPVFAAPVDGPGPAAAQRPEQRHPSGLALVGKPEPVGPLPEALDAALGEAERLAEENPKEFGYAWVDRAAGRIVLDVASARGRTLADAMRQRVAQSGNSAPDVRAVTHRQSDLEAVKHEAIDVAGTLAWQTEVDARNGRVIVTTTDLIGSVARDLVRRYGRDKVAVRVDPDRPDTAPQARTNDTSPFYGGARIDTPVGGCTNAFPWYSGTTSYMLTAGHCVRDGGSVSTPAESMGSVISESRENWHLTAGTQYLTGQTTYRGDIALIQVASGKSSGTRMFRGGADSNTSAVVGEMWSRRAQPGDQYCTGGSRSGEICGWTVDATRIDHRYNSGAVVRNAVISRYRQGWCTRSGDSGGPVYTVRADGRIAAKGIHSGGGGGGSDYYGGLLDQCWNVFTDIYDPYYAFPGYLRVG